MKKKAWSSVAGGDLVAALQRLLVELGDDAGEALAALRSDDKVLLKRVGHLMREKGLPDFVSHDKAKEIMGVRYITLGDAYEAGATVVNYNYKISDLGPVDVVPFSEVVLDRIKETHVLVACPSVSIMTMVHPSFLTIAHEICDTPPLRESPLMKYWLFRQGPGAEEYVVYGSIKPHPAHMVYANVAHRAVFKTGHLLGMPKRHPAGQAPDTSRYAFNMQLAGGPGGGAMDMQVVLRDRADNGPFYLSAYCTTTPGQF